ncbi:MAG TPA: hypothetical protein VK498_05180 [Ferruginibacter sp.]|nr:hypothetical protein [Ferruginibacter sp.]
MPIPIDEQVRIFKTLFRGRIDVFAVRWEKEGKSGYMPAYDLNWDQFSKHKAGGQVPWYKLIVRLINNISCENAKNTHQTTHNTSPGTAF